MSEPLAGTTLVLGLGNPILGDDGVGWRVVEEIEALLGARTPAGDGPCRPGTDRVEVDRLSLGGLRLMERLIGYERAILVDAIATGEEPPGTVRCLRLDDLPDRGRDRLASAHDSSLGAALFLGRALGAQLPGAPWVVAVEADLDVEVTDQLSPAVAEAVPRAAAEVMRLLELGTSGPADGRADGA